MRTAGIGRIMQKVGGMLRGSRRGSQPAGRRTMAGSRSPTSGRRAGSAGGLGGLGRAVKRFLR